MDQDKNRITKEKYKLLLLYLSLRTIYRERNGNHNYNFEKVRKLRSEVKRTHRSTEKPSKEEAIKILKEYHKEVFKP